jgi:hypothetical protein
MKPGRKLWLMCVALFCAYALLSPHLMAQNRNIDQKEALRIAEKFVTAHRYTEQLEETEPSIYWENAQRGSVRSLKLQSRAVKAFVKNEKGRRFWSVQFLFRQQPAQREHDLGREVQVSLDGKRIWLNPSVIKVWPAHNPL